jgi:hypothetical protein
MDAATKEALQAHARPTDEDYCRRFLDLDEHLHDAVVWASLLDKVVEDMARVPGMSSDEVNVACGALDRVNDVLQEAIKRLHATYHQRTKEETRA